MTLEECYESFGGDYQEVVNRLCSRAFVEKFLVKFLADKSHEDLHRHLDAGEFEEAFRAAHTLKGVCQNLGIKCLYESDYVVTEALRGSKNDVTPEMLQKLDADYDLVVASIREYQESAKQ